jgi:hypothetical protein
MIDGTRKRRDSDNLTKNRWYAVYRAQRFRRRFGWPIEVPPENVRACCTRFEPRSPSHTPGRTEARW